MLGSPRRPASCCNTACGRPFRHDRSSPLAHATSSSPLFCSPSPRSSLGACGGSDDEGGVVLARTSTSCSTQTFTGDKQMDSGKSRWPSRWRPRARAPSSCRARSSVTLDGPVRRVRQGVDAEVRARGRLRGRGPEPPGGRDVDRRQGLRLLPGHGLRRRRPGLPAVQDAVRAGPRAGRGRQDQGQSLATLGIDPRKWLTDPQNAGEAKVGDTDTIKITGGIDVAKLLDDVNTALAAASALGAAQGQQIPEKLTDDAEAAGRSSAIKDPKIEIYTGKDDKILRRLVLSLGLDGRRLARGTISSRRLDHRPQRAAGHPRAAGRAAVRPAAQPARRRSAPSAAVPPARAPARGSGGGADSGGAAGAGDFEAYSECLTKAGDDVAEGARLRGPAGAVASQSPLIEFR